MRPSTLPLLLAALALPVLSGCTVLAVGGAVVSVASTAVSAGVAVTKGAVNVATYPFRDSDEEKEEKRRIEEQEERDQEARKKARDIHE